MKSSNKQTIKPGRGRKKGEPISGIISHHYEFLSFMISLYEKGAMDQDFKTGQAALARFIEEKKLLLHERKGKLKPLSVKSIIVELNTVWKDILNDRKRLERNTKK